MPSGPSYQSRWSSATLSTAALSARHRVGVVELEAGQLHREHVVRRGVHHRLDDREADVADRDAAQPGRPQDRVEHLHGGGLAVGAGDREPRRGVLGVAQPPGQLDLAPDRDAAGAGLDEQRARSASSPGETTSRSASSGSSAVEPAPSRMSAPRTPSSSAFSSLPSGRLVERDHRGAEVGEVVGGGEAADAEARHHRADARPVVVAAEAARPGGHVTATQAA